MGLKEIDLSRISEMYSCVCTDVKEQLPQLLNGSISAIESHGVIVPVGGQVENLFNDYLSKKLCAIETSHHGDRVSIAIPWTNPNKGNHLVLPFEDTIFLWKMYSGNVSLDITKFRLRPWVTIGYNGFKEVSQQEFFSKFSLTDIEKAAQELVT